jgi:YD repeat-containing protein
MNINFKLKKFLFLFLLFSWYRMDVSAQLAGKISNVPVTIPPSPVAAALGKYGDWPVNNYTGVPQISLPLFNVGTSSIKVDISLSYHAGGVPVEDVGSWVGLGWSLNAGGVITRTVKGFPDELPNGFANITNIRYKGNSMPASYDVTNNSDDALAFSGIANGNYDSEPDVFSFNLGGKSGRLYLNASNQFTTPTYNEVKVSRNPITSYSPSGTNYWELIDETGTAYIFGKQEGTETSYVNDGNDGMYSYFPLGGVTSAWFLNQIISPDKVDTVNFNYVFKSESYMMSRLWSLRVPQTNDGTLALLDLGFGYSEGQPRQYFMSGTSQLSSVEWKTGRLVFESNGNRADMLNGKQLNKLKLYDRNNMLVKSYVFNYGYTNNRLFLNNLTEQNMADGLSGQYTFNYYPGIPGRNSLGQDYWGFYNGANGNENLIPYDNVLDNFQGQLGGIIANPNANREPAAASMIAGTISSIIYPTGGYTEFEFEPNDYSKVGDGFAPLTTYPSNPKAGGLRIKRIRSYTTASELASEKNYNYMNVSGMSTGTLYSKPRFASVSYQALNISAVGPNGEWPNCRWSFVANVTPYSIVEQGNSHGSPVAYSFVTELVSGGENGKVEYEYSSFDDEWNDVSFHAFYNQFGRPPFLPSTSSDYKRGLLLSKTVYGKNGSSYQPLNKTLNTYDYNDVPGSKNFQSLKVLLVKKIGDSSVCLGMTSSPAYQLDFRKYMYAYGFFKLKTVWPKLISTQEITYAGAGTGSATQHYFYEGTDHINPTRTEMTDSKGSTMKMTFKYAQEFAGTPVYDTMISRNWRSQIVEESRFLNNQHLETKQINFGFFNGSRIYPVNYKVAIGTGTPVTEYSFDQYDSHGNPVQTTDKAGLVRSFFYGYNKSTLVAEAAGSSYGNIVTQSGINVESLNAMSLSDNDLRTELNKLRSVPGTMVKSLTHHPAFGISSETDANGRTLYYQYDPFGRLLHLKDQNGNIVKKYCYNYAGQAVNCYDVVYTNSQTYSGQFTRNNCGPGYTGSTVSYSVPAGSVSSFISVAHANELAQQKLQTDGQAYANASGTCTAATIYARMECDNYNYSMYTTYGEMVIRFYSDAQCTQPVSVSNLIVNYDMLTTRYGTGNVAFCEEGYNASITANGYNFYIGWVYLDDNMDYDVECHYNYLVVNGTGYTPL